MNKDSGGTRSPENPGPEVKTDIGTQLAHERTDLAVGRSYLAAERTLMAWIRTSLSMISFGFTIGKLKDILQSVSTPGILASPRTVSIHDLAVFLVILGTVVLIAAVAQNLYRIRELRQLGLRRQANLPAIVAMALAVIGCFALTALIMAF